MPTKKTTGTSGRSKSGATTAKPRSGTGKSTVRKKTARGKPVSPEQRYRMIAESAYYMAEKSGFSGDNVAFWLAAEREIDKNLS